MRYTHRLIAFFCVLSMLLPPSTLSASEGKCYSESRSCARFRPSWPLISVMVATTLIVVLQRRSKDTHRHAHVKSENNAKF